MLIACCMYVVCCMCCHRRSAIYLLAPLFFFWSFRGQSVFCIILSYNSSSTTTLSTYVARQTRFLVDGKVTHITHYTLYCWMCVSFVWLLMMRQLFTCQSWSRSLSPSCVCVCARCTTTTVGIVYGAWLSICDMERLQNYNMIVHLSPWKSPQNVRSGQSAVVLLLL